MESKHTIRPGIVMLLALLLMGAVTASTIAISVTISRTLSQSRNLDNFIIASMAADSGLERGLGILKVARESGSRELAKVAINDSQTLAASQADFDADAVDDPIPITVSELNAGESLEFDILRPFGAGAPPHFLNVTATCDASCSSLDPDSLLELSWVVIANDGNTSYSGRELYSQVLYGAGQTVDLRTVRSEVADQPTPFSGSGPLGYRARVSAVRNALLDVVVTSCEDSLCVTPSTNIAGRIEITSTGEAGQSSERTQSIKRATVLFHPAASPLLNYVLFSEESIIP